MTTTEMKALYEANPESWIVIWKFSHFEDDYNNQWTDMRDDYSDGRFRVDHRAEYKLIHIKHKDILEAYLADNSVEIKFYLPYVMCTDGTELGATWEVDDNFIENYNQDLDYRLKEKIFNGRSEQDINNARKAFKEKEDGNRTTNDNMLNNNTNDVPMEALNNFQDFGFTANFEGEILKEVDGKYIGYILDNVVVPVSIDKEGKIYESDGSTYGLWLTPIKKEWYKNPDNFPILLIRKKVWKMFAMPNFDIRMINEQGWRLATKDELLSLYMEEDND